MPRPRKRRRVCQLPENSLFGPLNAKHLTGERTIMTIDEFETIRLIDIEAMTQEECAQRMNVARTTVQRIYNDARRKVAVSLVEGNILKIEGGDYKLCDGSVQLHGCGRCRGRRSGQN
ncbi:MAG: DUF134 domain-containing protein [Desulfotomaculaceae bacterium]|nr:DUF134 domain-containing protein [Desulfotomaculaceae bacterium]MDD4767179.1 DUF134 domain-containing protein [Desulfotomaculaceae bacterium]